MIEYKFKTIDKAAWYIYNALIHDFIHDFNNYGRMGKIQIYIQALYKDVTASVAGRGGGGNKNYNNLVGGDDDVITDVDKADTDFAAVIDEFCDDESISSDYIMNSNITDTGLKTAISNNIVIYNTLKLRPHMTRSKLALLQQMESSIKEIILVIISRINDISEISGSGGGKGPRRYNNNGGGGNRAIDNISKEVILNTIDTIIHEISDEYVKTRNENLISLFQIFLFIKNTFYQLDIQGISPLEILNNSLIAECTTFFILCNPFTAKKNIHSYSKIILNLFISKNKAKPLIPHMNSGLDVPTIIGDQYFRQSGTVYGGASGGAFTAKTYKAYVGQLADLDRYIEEYYAINIETVFAGSDHSIYALKKLYIMGDLTVTPDVIKSAYESFHEHMRPAFPIILGERWTSFTNKIDELHDRWNGASDRHKQATKKAYYDSITDFIFVKVINTYSDVKQKSEAASSASSSSSSSLSSDARYSVQRISKLVATKSLELIDLKTTTDADLKAQIDIIGEVASGSGYSSVDDKLLAYFQRTRAGRKHIKSKGLAILAITNVVTKTPGVKKQKKIRVINNAIESALNKSMGTVDYVKCPTSSVCDGMGTLANCSHKELTSAKKEYYPMDFELSDPDNSILYYGTTVLSNGNKKVVITYGCYAGGLDLTNIITLDISKAPIELQANTSFKGVINKIIEIWKSRDSVSDIDDLWGLLEFTDFFIDILKVGSKKAIGDIFQELNVVLENGGYTPTVLDISNTTTIGVMGDRPSGSRLLKLQEDAKSGTNPNVIGGYVNSNNSLVFVSDSLTVTAEAAGGGGVKRKSLKKIRKTRSTKTRSTKTRKKTRRNKKRKTRKTRRNKKRFSHKK